jgi:hypothetical protein
MLQTSTKASVSVPLSMLSLQLMTSYCYLILEYSAVHCLPIETQHITTTSDDKGIELLFPRGILMISSISDGKGGS